MPKWFSPQEVEQIQQRLLEQGNKLFTTYGLKKTNVAEIARAAGISKGAFYRFFPSKEALFLAVVEQVELDMRQQILAALDQPGPSPRARLYAVLKRAFDLLAALPILQEFTSGEYSLLLQRLDPAQLEQHLRADQDFGAILLARCRQADIPIRVSPEQILALLYPLILAQLHGAGLDRQWLSGGLDPLLDLVAAYCVGEIQLLDPPPPASASLENPQ